MAGKKVVVVDDEADIRDVVCHLLKDCGYEAVGFGAPAEAYVRAPVLKPELVIVDLRMPGITGLELIPMFQIVMPNAKYMVLSAYADRETAQDALRRGAAGVLWKPFKTKTFLDMVTRLLGEPVISWHHLSR
jgi:DNA-binding NtrC family response regulator